MNNQIINLVYVMFVVLTNNINCGIITTVVKPLNNTVNSLSNTVVKPLNNTVNSLSNTVVNPLINTGNNILGNSNNPGCNSNTFCTDVLNSGFNLITSYVINNNFNLTEFAVISQLSINATNSSNIYLAQDVCSVINYMGNKNSRRDNFSVQIDNFVAEGEMSLTDIQQIVTGTYLAVSSGNALCTKPDVSIPTIDDFPLSNCLKNVISLSLDVQPVVTFSAMMSNMTINILLTANKNQNWTVNYAGLSKENPIILSDITCDGNHQLTSVCYCLLEANLIQKIAESYLAMNFACLIENAINSNVVVVGAVKCSKFK